MSSVPSAQEVFSDHFIPDCLQPHPLEALPLLPSLLRNSCVLFQTLRKKYTTPPPPMLPTTHKFLIHLWRNVLLLLSWHLQTCGLRLCLTFYHKQFIPRPTWTRVKLLVVLGRRLICRGPPFPCSCSSVPVVGSVNGSCQAFLKALFCPLHLKTVSLVLNLYPLLQSLLFD